ncbi:MAG: fimbria/pilus periplasmic chaperone [Pseudomonas veronii]|jgi:P pilus assembly chaperone PapD|nr:fimbria/pilus periplasmic chaperone [Pseudomonas veronii]
MGWLKYMLTAGLLVGTAHTAIAGVVVGGTRVVYDGSRKEASISVKNTEKTKPYLIQSWVDDGAQTAPGKAPFIMTPPLFRLDAEQENVLRIIRTGGDFPQDRESVFWVNIKSIPASEKNRRKPTADFCEESDKTLLSPAGNARRVAECL